METKFSWTAPEHEWNDKSPDWYWWMGTAMVIAVGLAVWFKNYLFALLIFLGGFLSMTFAKREPGNRVVEITDRGVTVDGKAYDFRELDAFCIHDVSEHRDYPHLVLHKRMSPYAFTTFLIGDDIDIGELRTFLVTKLEEKEMNDSPFLQSVERMIS